MSAATQTKPHRVVSHAEWRKARQGLLAKEKEFTRQRDELNALRLELPWEKVEKQYQFDTRVGKKSLADLFDGRSQLLTYHFMLGPDWKEGCPGCSFVSDHADGAMPHLHARDVTLVMVSRAPLGQIETFQRRMGWKFPWVSSNPGDFNFDFGVSFTPEQIEKETGDYNYGTTKSKDPEQPGLSAFYKNEAGEIFHTYSTYARGLEPLVTTYDYLDFSPQGRNEEGLPFPMAWVRHHDKYGPENVIDPHELFSFPKEKAAQQGSHA